MWEAENPHSPPDVAESALPGSGNAETQVAPGRSDAQSGQGGQGGQSGEGEGKEEEEDARGWAKDQQRALRFEAKRRKEVEELAKAAPPPEAPPPPPPPPLPLQPLARPPLQQVKGDPGLRGLQRLQMGRQRLQQQQQQLQHVQQQQQDQRARQPQDGRQQLQQEPQQPPAAAGVQQPPNRPTFEHDEDPNVVRAMDLAQQGAPHWGPGRVGGLVRPVLVGAAEHIPADRVPVPVPERAVGEQQPLDPALALAAAAPASPELKPHTYLTNGLVLTNPLGRHPILDLIVRSSREWQLKLARQSRSLPEAVAEYQRRYGRVPPRGFGAWWAYVQRHEVQLPDEYDQIARDLEPFWGVSASEARAMQEVARAREGTYTLVSSRERGRVVLGGLRVEKEDEPRGMERARAQLELVHGFGAVWLDENGERTTVEREIVKATGDWEVTFGAGETPRELVDWEVDNDRRWKAKSGKVVEVARKGKQAYTGWAAACPPSSPLRVSWPRQPDLPLQPSEPKTFIHTQLSAMNPCEHTWLVHTSGFLISQARGPPLPETGSLLFGTSKTSLHADVLAVSTEGWIEDVSGDVPWEEKQDSRLVWRGSNAGVPATPESRWEASQRIRFVEMTGVHDALLQYPVLLSQADNMPVGRPQPRPQTWMNELLTDAAFVRGPVECSARACDDLWERFEFRSSMPLATQYGYKYAFDLDGKGPSERFKRLLTSRSMVLQSTGFTQWYTDRIQPWVHYVPVQVDLSDLYDILTFFAGDVAAGGKGGHDALAREIALQGREWSRAFWRKEDMVAYTWRLMLEYGRVVSDDRDNMGFELP
ncbi:glycosyltransferase family 90 protein [Calocera cornea HHB12733]|uniref:Glycosyltransferase family 90 protein n=1 Tax=Calocera cornea HHB12733 TaxID=1353952 RepID=A0A165EVW5_9BASI|nr:glycosyltransferase family 90 protein [Calocera cornea HHB12733]